MPPVALTLSSNRTGTGSTAAVGTAIGDAAAAVDTYQSELQSMYLERERAAAMVKAALEYQQKIDAALEQSVTSQSMYSLPVGSANRHTTSPPTAPASTSGPVSGADAISDLLHTTFNPATTITASAGAAPRSPPRGVIGDQMWAAPKPVSPVRSPLLSATAAAAATNVGVSSAYGTGGGASIFDQKRLSKPFKHEMLPPSVATASRGSSLYFGQTTGGSGTGGSGGGTLHPPSSPDHSVSSTDGSAAATRPPSPLELPWSSPQSNHSADGTSPPPQPYIAPVPQYPQLNPSHGRVQSYPQYPQVQQHQPQSHPQHHHHQQQQHQRAHSHSQQQQQQQQQQHNSPPLYIHTSQLQRASPPNTPPNHHSEYSPPAAASRDHKSRIVKHHLQQHVQSGPNSPSSAPPVVSPTASTAAAQAQTVQQQQTVGSSGGSSGGCDSKKAVVTWRHYQSTAPVNSLQYQSSYTGLRTTKITTNHTATVSYAPNLRFTMNTVSEDDMRAGVKPIQSGGGMWFTREICYPHHILSGGANSHNNKYPYLPRGERAKASHLTQRCDSGLQCPHIGTERCLRIHCNIDPEQAEFQKHFPPKPSAHPKRMNAGGGGKRCGDGKSSPETASGESTLAGHAVCVHQLVSALPAGTMDSYQPDWYVQNQPTVVRCNAGPACLYAHFTDCVGLTATHLWAIALQKFGGTRDSPKPAPRAPRPPRGGGGGGRY